MSDTYKGARLITTAGLTLTNGTFTGFVSGTTQTVTIAGARNFDSTGSNTSGMTLTAVLGVIYPIKCQHIKPALNNVTGFID
jgi:hypothetical protein